MACPNCGAEITQGQRFCAACGASLIFRCPGCGADAEWGNRFCRYCGTAINLTRLSREADSQYDAGQRRHLTVVFVDLVGSTALSERLDPEDVRDVIAGYHACVIDLAVRFNGFVARYFGDGVLVYFGHPQAHEDDADRAVNMALEVISAIRRLETPAGPPGILQARVGIATGLVVVATIGAGASIQVSAVGDAPNLAARLQAMAEPGMVVIADATRQLTGGLFEYADLGMIDVKGLREPVRAWAVLRQSPIEDRFEALRHARRPLVDREEELAVLQHHWRLARHGQGRAILLSGDAGIGKSRLVSAFEQSVADQPHVSLHLTCSSYHIDTPLYPLIRYLERVAGIEHGDAPAAQRAAIARLVAGSPAPEQDAALFAHLLSLPIDAEDYANTLMPRQRKEKTFAAILRLLESQARREPLILVLEDLHWADATTLELLALLVDRAGTLQLMVLITARPDAHPDWASRQGIIHLALNGLSHRHSTELIANVLMDKVLPSSVVETIIAHSDGVPLFVEELTASVLEQKTPADRPDAPASPQLSSQTVPTSLQASLLARLDRHAHLREIAQSAAVIGREFSFGLLRTISGLSAEQLTWALLELVRAGVLFVRGTPPDAIYSFKHALVQDAAYGSLLRERRRTLHRRLAEALAQDDPTMAGGAPQLIAWHFAEGGVPSRAVDYYLKAAESATGRSALTEMASHLRNGLRQVRLLPESPATLHQELSIQVALGRTLIDHQGSGSEEVREAFARARDLCLELQDTHELLRVHDGLMNHHITRAQPEQVLQYADEMLEVGTTSGDPQAFLMALRSRGFANLLLGRLEAARDDFHRLLELYDPRRDGPGASLTARDPKVSVCTLLGMDLTVMGYPDSGKTACQEALHHAGKLDHVVSMVLGLRRACVQCMIAQDVERAAAMSQRLLAMDAEHEIFLGTREGGIFKSWAQLYAGADRAALEHLRFCIAELDAAKHWLMLPFFMACAAERHAAHDEHAHAAELLERAAALSARTREAWCLGEILRLQACFVTRAPEEAEALLRRSLAIAGQQGAKLWELRAAIALAERIRDRGDPAAARTVVQPLLSWFSEGHSTPDLIAARRLLDTL